MKKYKTKPINFDGCHPVIAKALKLGEAIECRVWVFSEKPPAYGCSVVWIGSYQHGASHPYAGTNDTLWKHAEPIPLKVKRIMPPERAIPVLIAEGFAFTSTGYLAAQEFILTPYMYALMGKDLDGDISKFAWPPCIIEEVDE